MENGNKSKMTIVAAVIAIALIGGGVLLFMNKDDMKNTDTPMASQATQPADEKPKTAGTIVDVAAANPDFSTLVDLVKTAGLVDTLSGTGPYTVFAPTNEAFAKLPAETVTALKADPAKLAKILTYHVVSGKVQAKDVITLNEAKTVEGSTVMIKVTDGVVKLNDSTTVTATDIETSNGLIHVIDTVLMPPTM